MNPKVFVFLLSFLLLVIYLAASPDAYPSWWAPHVPWVLLNRVQGSFLTKGTAECLVPLSIHPPPHAIAIVRAHLCTTSAAPYPLTG